MQEEVSFPCYNVFNWRLHVLQDYLLFTASGRSSVDAYHASTHRSSSLRYTAASRQPPNNKQQKQRIRNCPIITSCDGRTDAAITKSVSVQVTRTNSMTSQRSECTSRAFPPARLTERTRRFSFRSIEGKAVCLRS